MSADPIAEVGRFGIFPFGADFDVACLTCDYWPGTYETLEHARSVALFDGHDCAYVLAEARADAWRELAEADLIDKEAV